jgi:outer membrane protein OmpA-like peptidoglycan-associated protein
MCIAPNLNRTEMKPALLTPLVALGLAVAALLPVLSFAQSAAVPTVDEVVGKLSAARDGAKARTAKTGVKTRGIVFSGDSEEASGGSVELGGAVTDVGDAPSKGVAPAKTAGYSETRIQFEFNSDQLTGFAKSVLDVFAAAIQSAALKDTAFIIEGHTDGVGSDQYNLDLSRKRAEAVVRYLTEGRGIALERLSARGKGKRELANRADFAAAENRRVVWLPLR